MEEKSSNANISAANLLGKLKIILKLVIIENCKQIYFSGSLVFFVIFWT